MKLLHVTNSLLFFCFHSLPCYSQSLHEFERHLGSIFDRHNAFLPKALDQKGFDSLSVIDSEVYEYLHYALPNIPRSLTDLISCPEGLSIASSADHRVRIWNWSVNGNSVTPPMYHLIEFQSRNGIKTELMSDSVVNGWQWSIYDTVYSVKRASGAIVYLPTVQFTGSRTNAGEAIMACIIEKDSLIQDVALFNSPKKELKNLVVTYNFVTNQRFNNRIQIKNHDKTLLIPLVLRGDPLYGDTMTRKFIRYEFDGEHFVYKGILKK